MDIKEIDGLIEKLKLLKKYKQDSSKRCEKRGSLEPGTSRAKVTTYNAKRANCAEACERIEKDIIKMLKNFIN